MTVLKNGHSKVTILKRDDMWEIESHFNITGYFHPAYDGKPVMATFSQVTEQRSFTP